MMHSIISEHHTESNMSVRGTVEKIIRYQRPDTIEDLREILILDNTNSDRGFGCNNKLERKIEIYLDITLKFQLYSSGRIFSATKRGTQW
jgi:hypothetical protein